MPPRPPTPMPLPGSGENSADEETCPVCLTDTSTLTSGKLLRLSCSHVLCVDCADAASSRGLAACPICRTPQLLDRAELAKRTQEFRTEYNAWRAGASRGSTGELNEISAPAKPKGLASS